MAGLSNSEPDPDWFLYDSEGMIHTHSILGSMDDFRSYAAARGMTEVLKRIPSSDNQVGALTKHESNAVENQRKAPSSAQTKALENWNTHMKLRKHQQDSLSGLLSRPTENLLMNCAHRFRETQEKKEMLSHVLPLVQSGYGHNVGSGFWRLPQYYGAETSGIASTLTKTERGIGEPCTLVGLPSSIREESGLKKGEIMRDSSRAWDQSRYLKQQCQMLSEVTQDVDFKRLDMDNLEVIGSCKPFYSETCGNVSLENTVKEEQANDLHKHMTLQSASQNIKKSKQLCGPALRISGQLAKWTGNSKANQGQAGMNTTLFFDILTGELQTSHIELYNEGSTAIFYSWERVSQPQIFTHLLPIRRQHFYFNSCDGVILPGETQNIQCIFNTDRPGIQREVWQLNTHPLLLQGASIQVNLKGVALLQDRTADYRLYIEKRLEKKMTAEMCRLIVNEIVEGIHTPERPSSPAEQTEEKTEEQEFRCKNHKFYYNNQPIEELKKLWHNIKPHSPWDLSVSTLRQAVLSLPDDEAAADDCLNLETGLTQLNALLLQLSEPSPELPRPSVTIIGQVLWRETVETITREAVRLTHLHHLPEISPVEYKKRLEKKLTVEMRQSIVNEIVEGIRIPERPSSPAEQTEEQTEEQEFLHKNPKKKLENKMTAEMRQSVVNYIVQSILMHERPSSPAEQTEEQTEEQEVLHKKPKDRKKREESPTDRVKSRRGGHNTETDLQLSEPVSEDPASDAHRRKIYTRVLHQQIYGLIENLVDSICDVAEEFKPSADITL